MKYEEPRPISRDEADRIFAGSNVWAIEEAIVAMALNEPDFDWIQSRCLALTNHEDWTVRAIAATCLGHVARIHRRLDLTAAMTRLNELLADPRTAGYAETALEDVNLFVRSGTSR